MNLTRSAAHSPGQEVWRGQRHLRGQLLGRRPPKCLQETLHDRMLLLAELLRIALAQPTDDGERGELRLGGEPSIDCGDVRIEHGWRSHSPDVVSLGPPVRTAQLAGFDGSAEFPRKGRCIGRRRWHREARGGLARTSVDAFAELGLGGAHLSQKRHRVERAMHAPQTRLGGPSDLRMPNRALKGSRRRVVALDDLGTLAPLLLQLDGWKKFTYRRAAA